MPRPMRRRLQAIGLGIGSGQHGQHTGQGQRGCDINGENAGMRMGRAQHHRIDLSWQIDIIAVAALTGQQHRVFASRQGLTDGR